MCLALTCGLPGAGKTSLCNALSAYSKSDLVVRHICFDDVIECDAKDEGMDFTNAGTFKVIQEDASLRDERFFSRHVKRYSYRHDSSCAGQ